MGDRMKHRDHMGHCNRGAAVLGKDGRYGVVGNEATFDESAYGTLKVKVKWLKPKDGESETWEALYDLRQVQRI